MPPKQKRHDWSWISEVSDVGQITDQHRLRAAGLTDLIPCTYAYPTCHPDIIPAKDKSCSKKRCGANPRCLNYVGVAHLLEPKGKERYVEEKLGTDIQRGEGMPAGLRNLGATCYANAFLQLWFHNIAFRNGIYACESLPNSPLFHLTHIFASLQYTEKTYVDPWALINSLRLNKGEQQDAAEFSKLFLDMISNELSKQKDGKIRSLIDNMFQGTIRYTTTCDCGFASHRDSTFLEVELSLKEGATLADRFEHALSHERLQGDNQYHCQSCDRKRDATRSTTITSYPPVLHFSLLRFVFDAKTYERRKSRASIKFPRQMKLGGHHYRLQAIITHSGPNAHQGHFVCETRDESTDTWYMCNDEEVTRITRDKVTHGEKQYIEGSEPINKKPKLKQGFDDLSSKDAYMLVYTRMDTSTVTAPPDHIMQLIKAEQAELEVDQMEREARRERLEDEYAELVGAKKQVAMCLPGTDCIVPTTELERWFAADNMGRLFSEWTIPLCAHGAVDPDSTGLYKLISADAFEILQTYGKRRLILKFSSSSNGTTKGASASITATPDDASRSIVLSNIGPEAGCNGQHKRDSISASSSLKAPAPASDGHSPARDSHSAGSPGASSSQQANEEKFRNGEKSSTSLGPTSCDFLRQLSICPTCVEETYRVRAMPGITDEDRDFWKAEAKHDKQIAKMMDGAFAVYGVDYYYLPGSFVDGWLNYIKSPEAPRPQLSYKLGRCEHDMLDVDLEMDKIRYISEKGWNLLIDKYGNAEPVTFQLPSRTPPNHGKRLFMSDVSTPTCQPCRRKRLIDFEETEILLTIERASNSTSRRSMPKEREHDVRKTTRMLDIKVYQTKVVPSSLKIIHNGRELANEETVESADILSGDRILCKEIQEVIEVEDEPVEEERGFGGTALHGRQSCPGCTFENDAQATFCAICETPFNLDEFK